ncbi:hypothetical protein GCM10023094_00190 [Rhodococcus olei]|uniref:Uncharacterized protein n=1 Tax=Rhodococcus olei TaxID=2161675 RepID=A0ABP8NPK0_9NOCA
MAFTVTSQVGEGGGTTEDRYGDDAHFTVHDSGALFVARPDEEVIYAPGVWLRVFKSNQASDSATGNYV